MAGDRVADAAMSIAATGQSASLSDPVPTPKPTLKPAPVAAPDNHVPNGRSMMSRASWAAKKLTKSSMFMYIVVFAVVIALLAIIRPQFVLQRPLPSPDDPDAKEKLSIKRVMIIAVVAVGIAAIGPLLYEHRASIVSKTSAMGKSIKSMFGK